MADLSQQKRAIMAAQFGKYMPLVADVSYQELVDAQIPLQFEFKKIDDQAAFYMVINGYMAAFSNHLQKHNLIQRGHHYRQGAEINSDLEAAYLQAAWQVYEAIKKQEAALGKKNRTSVEVTWDRLFYDSLVELHDQQEALFNHLGQDFTDLDPDKKKNETVVPKWIRGVDK
ncbi:hypothetical protein AWM75_01035 [Aerococcus urinaehominis]|uniref:Uncharacterized protein n=1 Tax=Aerococcus urinaehominis TaxID=128944 RepID=A0A0X8FL69_9LACT|nr:hypothetical protein [Aerococcus urinaehominis]AMB98662.1 hypothetical protein AWM75_01035 [Aerococcus urinaehominis]SDL97669.1 hypothetical protein SAMN04487985_10368 [Aerococcus urinaehominis]